MAFDDDLLKAVGKQIDGAKDPITFVGTVYSVSPLLVVLDGANVPIECIALQHDNLTIAKRVVVLKVGPNPVVLGTFGSRVANFPSYTATNPVNNVAGDAWTRTDLNAVFVNIGGAVKRLGPQTSSLVACIGATRPSRWYWIQHNTATTATLSLGAGARSVVFPFTVFEDKVMSGVVWEITTAGGAGSVTRFGIHADQRGQPTGGVVFDAGGSDSTSTGIKGWTGLSVVLPAGQYWIEIASQGGDPTYRCIASGFGYTTPGMSSVGQLSAQSNPRQAYRYEPRASTFTTLAAHDDSAWTATIPVLQMQFSSPV